jgi:hypothetical protein
VLCLGLLYPGLPGLLDRGRLGRRPRRRLLPTRIGITRTGTSRTTARTGTTRTGTTRTGTSRSGIRRVRLGGWRPCGPGYGTANPAQHAAPVASVLPGSLA